MRLKLLNIMTGISAKSGKRYMRITVRGNRTDRGSNIADFWLTEEVANQLIRDGIEIDDYVSIEMSLDEETLKSYVSCVELVEKGVN